MKYLCLIYSDEAVFDALPAREAEALVREHLAYDDALRQSGHFIVAEALEPTRSAILVRVRDGKVSATDGPYAETKEQIGGFFLIEARDLNEAIQVAAKIPSARLSLVEVRPIRELPRA